MDELTFTDPCILFALKREAQPFLRQFRPHQHFPGAPCWARFCGPSWLTVLVLETGVGPARSRQAIEWLLGQPVPPTSPPSRGRKAGERPALGNVPYLPRVVLAAGFAGALQENYRVGDVILASEVVDAEGKCWPTSWPGELPSGEWQPPLHRGRVLTMPHLVAGPEEKQALDRRHEAIAVDMESAMVANWCSRRNVPFGCVRVISDDLYTPLSPRLAHCFAGGRVSPLRLLALVARSPGIVPELLRLGKGTRAAARQLALALGELLTLTLPWGTDL